MRKYIKYMLGSFDNASRNKRELSVVRMFDCEIIVCDFGNEQCVNEIDGYTVYRRMNQLSKISLIRKFQIIYNWFIKEPNYLRHKRAYCISCHDLIALLIGWLSTCFLPKDKKPKLVYDSHEFELERNTGGKRGRLTKYIIQKVEKFLINKCAFSIMVNDSIADEVQRIHGLKKRPVVVRNIPNYWTIDESICKEKKQEFCEQLGVSKETFLVMYHGGIIPGRGIENLLLSIQKNQNIAAVILGNGQEEYIGELKRIAEKLDITGRVLFREVVPISELWQYVGASDVGVTIAPNFCLNHYYMLPNKLFENIQSLTPIIGSDFPEIRRIIKGYDIGLCVNPESVGDIANAIEEMRTNKEMYNRFKNNLKKAKEELCWENERQILETAYAEILR